jgi:hypothetical protein
MLVRGRAHEQRGGSAEIGRVELAAPEGLRLLVEDRGVV